MIGLQNELVRGAGKAADLQTTEPAAPGGNGESQIWRAGNTDKKPQMGMNLAASNRSGKTWI